MIELFQSLRKAKAQSKESRAQSKERSEQSRAK